MDILCGGGARLKNIVDTYELPCLKKKHLKHIGNILRVKFLYIFSPINLKAFFKQGIRNCIFNHTL